MFEPIIFLIDDDHAVRDSLSLLIRSVGLNVRAFAHPQEFLDQYDPSHVGCIVLDIRMPGMSGFSVHDIVRAGEQALPVIFITGHGDVAQCRRAFQHGASDFLTKPVDEHVLLESLQKAIGASVALHRRRQSQQAIVARFDRLTAREHEICRLMAEGLPNKLIAKQLALSLRTVENHRAAVFAKLEAASLAELIKLALAGQGEPAPE